MTKYFDESDLPREYPSGRIVTYPSGMKRGPDEGKPNYLLVRDGPMFERWVWHLSNAAHIHGPRNWMKANGPEDLERFRESAARHFDQWLKGETDEDHAASIFFNVNGFEYVANLKVS